MKTASLFPVFSPLLFVLLPFGFSGCEKPPLLELTAPVPFVYGSADHTSLRIQTGEDAVRIVGKILPAKGTLSVSYSGACGDSYYREIETSEGNFTHTVSTAHIRRLDFLVTAPDGVSESYTMDLIRKKRLETKGEDECDYLDVRRNDELHPVAYVVSESCYEIGYKYGSCTSRKRLGMPCKSGTDISIPFRCRDKEETRSGIEAGRL